MKFNDLDKENPVFSCLCGYNFYYPKINEAGSADHSAESAVHAADGTKVSFKIDKAIDAKSANTRWRYLIEHPVDTKYMTWPVDIIEKDGAYSFVYEYVERPPLEMLKTILYRDSALDWRTPQIKKLVMNILKTFDEIHSNGYSYHSFNIEKMYFNPDTMDVFLDFSTAIGKNNYNLYDENYVLKQDRGIEFLPLWRNMDEDNYLCLADDLNSLATLLFRLMIGRMPYQGRSMDADRIMDFLYDRDSVYHNIRFHKYRETPIFLFDPNDKSNSIGIFTHDELFIGRWNSLAQNIKDMFISSFETQNVERDLEEKVVFTAREWIDALESCWKGEN